MNRSVAKRLKNGCEDILNPIERLHILCDIRDGISEDEIQRRYSSATDHLDHHESSGFVYYSNEKYQLTTLGEKFLATLSSISDITETQQKFKPVFEQLSDWQSILPQLELIENATVCADLRFNRDSEQAYLNFLSGAEEIREINPHAKYHRMLLDCLIGKDDPFLRDIDSPNVNILVPDTSPMVEEINKIKKEADNEYIDYTRIPDYNPYILTITESKVGIWIHESFEADRSVFIYGDDPDLYQWAENKFKLYENDDQN